jgi:hypothetical protein
MAKLSSHNCVFVHQRGENYASVENGPHRKEPAFSIIAGFKSLYYESIREVYGIMVMSWRTFLGETEGMEMTGQIQLDIVEVG